MSEDKDKKVFCPMFNTLCLGASCAWWIDSHGLEPGCAIQVLARSYAVEKQSLVSRGEIELMIEGASGDE